MKKISFKAIGGFALIIGVFPWVVDSFPSVSHWVGLMVLAGIYSLITIGLSLFMGYTGQISLGHAAFFGIGAYSSAVLTVHFDWNPWLVFVVGMVIAGAIAYIVGSPSLKLKGHYLAMATLAFGIIIFIVFTEEVNLTGGPDGMEVARLTIFGYPLSGDFHYYYAAWGSALLAFIFSINLIQSRTGRALRAIHTSEAAAGAMGINVAAYKIKIFVFSAVLASFAGSLFAHYMEFVNPSSFSIIFSVELLIMLVLGGIHHIWGAILGAILVTFLSNEFLHSAEEFEVLVFGGILLLLTIFMPDGLTSLYQKLPKFGASQKTRTANRSLIPKPNDA